MAYVVGGVEVADFSSALRLATAPLRTGQPLQASRLKQAALPTTKRVLVPKSSGSKQVLAPTAKQIIAPPTLEVKGDGAATGDGAAEKGKGMPWGILALIAAGGVLWYMMRRK